MIILGIETSCDETAAAVVADGVRMLGGRVASQVEIHARFGGVVPEVASRQHLLAIIPVISEAMAAAGVCWDELDAVAVTAGPGLAGSLLVGVNAAKAISVACGLPLIAVNHLEGHIYACWITGASINFPLLCLIASGGHSDMVLMRGHGDYRLLGQTRDDAAGEAFDKAARILGLGYPGGPAIENSARRGVALVKLPRAWLRGTYDFSFSGLKTALLRLVESGRVVPSQEKVPGLISRQDAAASFQEAVVDVLVTKAVAAARDEGVKQILLVGGVAANQTLRQRFLASSPVPVLSPEPALCTDNAAMVAACGYYRFQDGHTSGLDFDVVPGLKLV
jgi:N6-L-threonylcarbamoyladenine synthase